MAVFDIRSNLSVVSLFNAAIVSNTTTNTASIDTADFDYGFMVSLFISARTDGTFTLSLEDSDDDSTFAAVAANKLIGTAASSVVTAAGVTLATLGAFSTRQFIRVVITSTAVTSGATVQVVATMEGENVPVTVV